MLQKSQGKPKMASLRDDFKKIRESSLDDISDVLNYLIELMNIKTDINDLIQMNRKMLIVADLIRTKFGHLTGEEIKEAFKMYVAKEFPHVKVFRILDAISVGEVLNSYTTLRNEKLKQYNNRKSIEYTEPEYTQDQKEQIYLEWEKDFLQRFKDGGRVSDAHLMYSRLDIVQNLEEKKKLYERMKQQYLSDTRMKSAAKYTELIDNPVKLKKHATIQNMCKSFLVLEYLKEK